MTKDILIRLLNLLTFLVAALCFAALCYTFFYCDMQPFKRFSDILFVVVMLSIAGGISWKTGTWAFAKTAQINGWALLAFWLWLSFLYAIISVAAIPPLDLGQR